MYLRYMSIKAYLVLSDIGKDAYQVESVDMITQYARDRMR